MGRLLTALLSDAESLLPAIPAILELPQYGKTAESQESQRGRCRNNTPTTGRIAESQESHDCEVPQIEDQTHRLLAIIRSEGFADELLGRDDSTPSQLAELPDAGLRAYALALHTSAEREAGRVPFGWDHVAHCDGCGPVWLWTAGKVLNCPWCWNRRALKAIPRPRVRCGDCLHWLPDKINPDAGIGACGLNLQYRAGELSRFPMATRICSEHKPKGNGSE